MFTIKTYDARCSGLERMKAEILADIASGVVPATVADYSELHDSVDANGYGGAFECWTEGVGDGFWRFWNRAQDAADRWLRAGRPG